MEAEAGTAGGQRRLRVHYAKRGRLRFTSHRDVQRAVERGLRRAGVPVAFSEGFSPHPRISYAGAAPTGVASEAEYLEVVMGRACAPDWVREVLDAALPRGLDIVEVLPARGGVLADRLEASIWEARFSGVEPDQVDAAAAAFLRADRIEVERLTKKGRRRFDAREPVVSLQAHRSGVDAHGGLCAILRIVVRHTTPAVRPDDVLAGLRQVADLAPPVPPMVARLAQGPLDVAGGVADPLAPDRDERPSADESPPVRPGEADARVVGAESRT